MGEKEERDGVGKQEWGERKNKSTYANRMDPISTSFFITNFPDGLGWGDLWKLFTKYGSVSDVYIPNKVHKWGRKFGFVKFKDVRDVEALSRSMEDVWSGTFKLWVNRARYGKGEEKEKSTTIPEQTQRRKEYSDSRVKDDVSFKSLLLRRKEGGEVEESGGVKKSFRLNRMEDLASLELQVNDETLRELHQSKVAFLRKTVDFQTFSDRLNMEKHHEVKATHMGEYGPHS
jgi:RNA recognition motif-containing protein